MNMGRSRNNLDVTLATLDVLVNYKKIDRCHVELSCRGQLPEIGQPCRIEMPLGSLASIWPRSVPFGQLRRNWRSCLVWETWCHMRRLGSHGQVNPSSVSSS